MIVFITAQDEPTQDNLQVAGHIATLATPGLCGHHAVRDNIINALSAAPAEPFLALSHGQPDFLRGHDTLPAVTLADAGLLSGRESFALACYTAAILGPGVSAQGGIWFGFAGPINCLPADPHTIHHFRSIADFVANRFPGCNTLTRAEAFINDLNNLVDRAFDAIDASGTYTFEIFHALRDITRRLRIWLPHAVEAVRHPEAFGDFIL